MTGEHNSTVQARSMGLVGEEQRGCGTSVGFANEARLFVSGMIMAL